MSASSARHQHIRPFVSADSPSVDSRAYGGAAHGRHWQSIEADGVQATVRVRIDDSVLGYRLVVSPLTGMPAQDPQGNFVFVPVEYSLALPDEPAPQ